VGPGRSIRQSAPGTRARGGASPDQGRRKEGRGKRRKEKKKGGKGKRKRENEEKKLRE
jgi:hypothetical protein